MANAIVREELIDRKFGRWIVLGLPSSGRKYYCNCRCSCGTNREVLAKDLVRGRSKSCGCVNSENTTARNMRHGLTESPEYSIWCGIKKRCYDQNEVFFCNYGGRGIKVCERWLHSFENFLSDMGIRPTNKHSIERRNNDGDYEPDNCYWATRDEQARNKRNNRRVEIGGETMIIADWAKRVGLRAQTIAQRLFRGWSERDAILIPQLRHPRKNRDSTK